MVPDVRAAVRYYCEILGFQFSIGVTADHQDITAEYEKRTDLIYAMVSFGDVTVMFQEIESLKEDVPALAARRDIGGSLTLYIETENVEALFQSVRDRARIVQEPAIAFYGMREFYLTDLNGYVLGFAEPVKT